MEILGGHKHNLACTRTQGKGAVTPQETESDFPVTVWGVFCGGIAQQWPAVGSGELTTTVVGALACWHEAF